MSELSTSHMGNGSWWNKTAPPACILYLVSTSLDKILVSKHTFLSRGKLFSLVAHHPWYPPPLLPHSTHDRKFPIIAHPIPLLFDIKWPSTCGKNVWYIVSTLLVIFLGSSVCEFYPYSRVIKYRKLSLPTSLLGWGGGDTMDYVLQGKKAFFVIKR